MKNLILLLFLIPLFAVAQTSHTVKPKESLYSLARKYNVHPRELAAFNNISVETSLAIGQIIKIPSKTSMAPLNESTAVSKEPESKPTTPVIKESANPIYHKVEKKETLYHISKLYPNISMDDIRKWNHISGDALNEGDNLIVGYAKENVSKVPEVKKENKIEEIKAVVKETAKTPEPEKKEIVKEQKPVTKEIVKEEIKEPEVRIEPNNVTGKNFNGGVFKKLYNSQSAGNAVVKEETGNAGIFKSTSGWEDGKYYCLTNLATPGSIVKITNPLNNRAVYAKVLDLIPDLKQNEGMVIRISNAAASELGTESENFETNLNFIK